MNCEEIRTQLDALFVGDAMRGPLKVRSHMRHCGRCRGWFEELVSVERALGGGEELAEGGFERRYSDAVVFAIARAADSEAGGLLAVWSRLRRGWASLAMGAAVVAACVGAGLFIAPLLGGVEPIGDGFEARSGKAAVLDRDRAVRGGVHQIEIFCVERMGEEVQIRARDPVTGALSCGLGGELKFAYINRSLGGERALEHLTLVGIDGQGGALWYRPVVSGSAEAASVEVSESAQTALLGQTIRLSINHGSGRVSIFGIFSAAPLSRASIGAWLAAGAEPDGLNGIAVRDARGERGVLGDRGVGEYVLSVRALKILEESGGAP